MGNIQKQIFQKMNSNLILLCMALAITTVIAQDPKPCETPSLWHARHHQYDPIKRERSRGFTTYDATHKRKRFVEEFEEGQDKEAFDVLELHSIKTVYEFNFKTKECKKYEITHDFRDFGIPRNAKSVGESYIGSSGIPGAGLLTTLWEDDFKDSKGEEFYYFGQWTYDACLPIQLQVFCKPSKDQKALDSHDRFYDVVPGADPEAFKLRKECEKL